MPQVPPPRTRLQSNRKTTITSITSVNPLSGLASPVVLAGIGNNMKGDDGAGPAVIERLQASGSPVASINCGDIPENYLGKIAALKPATIVFVDAVEMNEPAGTVRLFTSDKIISGGASTHGMSLDMLARYLAAETGAAVYLLGIQPKSVALGATLSPEVEAAVKALVSTLQGEYHA